MKTVGDVLHTKGTEVWTVRPDQSVLDALRIMSDREVGALLVLEEDHMVGLFSERDYARKCILAGRASKNTRVREIMTERVLTVEPSWPLERALALITHERIRHLPVVDEGRLEGLVSIGDLVKGVIDDQRFLIEQLERYVSS